LFERQHPDADEGPGRTPLRGLSGHLDHDWISYLFWFQTLAAGATRRRVTSCRLRLEPWVGTGEDRGTSYAKRK
jgi:hypothetical protein